jgi:hypothetical protein
MLDVLNGANPCIIGNEVIQYVNATLNVDGTYTLDTLLRGRRGTETYCRDHAFGETFIVLNTASIKRISLSLSLIGLIRYYKAVTLGQSQSSGQVIPQVLAANDLKPYAPAQLVGNVDSGTGDVNASWERRTRVGGAWQDGVGDVPLSEDSEGYDFDIMYLLNTVRKQYYTTTPSTGLCQTGFDPTVLPSGSYFIRIAQFTMTWEDGHTANYAGPGIGTVAVGGQRSLGGSIRINVTGSSVTDGYRLVYVYDPDRLGDQFSGIQYKIQDVSRSSGPPFLENAEANDDGFWLIGVIPPFLGGQPATYYASAEGGDAAIHKFVGLSLKQVTYTHAQQVAEWGHDALAFHSKGYYRARVYQKSGEVGRGFGAENRTLGKGNVISGGSDATSILGVPITGTPIDGDLLQYNVSANEWQIVGPML